MLVYTSIVLDDLIGFDWDVHNAGHVAAHEVMPQKVEEAVRGRHVVIPACSKGWREALEIAWQGGIGTLLGRGVHHPPKAIPHRHGVHDESSGKEDLCPANRKLSWSP
jgi:hypothetical protein